jgi:two-component system, LytTR family, sensor kinase
MKINFQTYRFWWFNIISWSAYYIVLAFFSPFCLAYPPVERFFYLLPSWFLIILLTTIYRFIHVRFNFNDKRLVWIVLQVVISTFVIWEIDVFVRFNFVYQEILNFLFPNVKEVITRTPYGRALNFIYEKVRINDNDWEHFSAAFNSLNQLIKFTVIVIWLVIYNFLRYNTRFQEIKYANLMAENKLKEVELVNLRQQLNPHFLFNALNSIHALVSLKEERAENAVLNLSDLMRYTLNYEKRDFVTVKEEMDVVRKYLELEKIRFDKRLTYELLIDSNTLNLKLPLLMVQTLVENAIKHAVRHNIQGGHVIIKTQLENTFLNIHVINSGQYCPSHQNRFDAESSTNGGIGLVNINRRLNMYFGENASFDISNLNDKEVIANLCLPKVE